MGPHDRLTCSGLALAELLAGRCGAEDLEVGDILVAEPSGSRVMRVDPVSGAQTVAASGSPMLSPLDVSITADRHILVVDGDAFSGGGDGITSSWSIRPGGGPPGVA